MKCLIVDEDPEERKLLTTHIAAIQGCTIAGVCRNAMEAYDALQAGKTALLFVDTRMPVLSDTDFLRSLKNPPLVIFTTTGDQYAVEPDKPNVVDYLPKPITMPRLLQAVDKAKERFREKLLAGPEAPVDYTFVKQDNQLVKVWFRDIRFVEGMQNYIRIYLADSVMVVPTTLKAFEKVLPPSQFIRVHRSYIASVLFIAAIRSGQVALNALPFPLIAP